MVSLLQANRKFATSLPVGGKGFFFVEHVAYPFLFHVFPLRVHYSLCFLHTAIFTPCTMSLQCCLGKKEINTYISQNLIYVNFRPILSSIKHCLL